MAVDGAGPWCRGRILFPWGSWGGEASPWVLLTPRGRPTTVASSDLEKPVGDDGWRVRLGLKLGMPYSGQTQGNRGVAEVRAGQMGQSVGCMQHPGSIVSTRRQGLSPLPLTGEPRRTNSSFGLFVTERCIQFANGKCPPVVSFPVLSRLFPPSFTMRSLHWRLGASRHRTGT